jgi:hypothetical protein
MTELSQDPFVNKEVAAREQRAFEDGVKQGKKLAAETIRRAGRGMWDHIALIAEGKVSNDSR